MDLAQKTKDNPRAFGARQFTLSTSSWPVPSYNIEQQTGRSIKRRVNNELVGTLYCDSHEISHK